MKGKYRLIRRAVGLIEFLQRVWDTLVSPLDALSDAWELSSTPYADRRKGEFYDKGLIAWREKQYQLSHPKTHKARRR